MGFIVIHRTLPETKGKSLEQIERELVDENPVTTARRGNALQPAE
jgi:hypothetical protein